MKLLDWELDFDRGHKDCIYDFFFNLMADVFLHYMSWIKDYSKMQLLM